MKETKENTIAKNADKQLTDDWVECELGEVAKIYNGNSINKQIKEEKYQKVDVGFNYIGTKDVGVDGKIIYETGVKIPEDEKKFKVAPKNCVLVCSEGGSAGKKTAFVEKDICFGNKLYAITNNEGYLDGKYVYYYTRFKKFFGYFKNQMNGIIGGVSQKKFKKIPIPLPPLVVQKAIAKKIDALFSSLDDGITDLKKAQEQLKTYRQSVLKKAFEGEWEKVNVGYFFDFVGGGTPSKSNSDYWNGDLSWASIKDIKGDFLNTTKDYITELGLQSSSSKVAEIGEVILATRINPGKSIIAGIRTAINQDLKIVKPKFEIPNRFIHYLFKSIERDCLKVSSGTTVLGINLKNLKEIEVPKIENIQEQNTIVQEIESRLSVCDAVEENIKQGLEKAEQLRQSILKKAFSGKLLNEKEIEECRNHLDYEPAEKLLERIKIDTR